MQAVCTEKFFRGCSIHEMAKKNEKNICCLDCCTSICPHCVHSHRSHRLLQVRRYVYNDVVRLEDLEKLFDCSNIQVPYFLFNCHDLHIIQYIAVHMYCMYAHFGFMHVTKLVWLYMIRHTRSMLQKWCSSGRGLRIGSSKAQLITVLLVIDASKNHFFIAPLAAR